jgi:tetratricopeptide (TPR) repeat protein
LRNAPVHFAAQRATSIGQALEYSASMAIPVTSLLPELRAVRVALMRVACNHARRLLVRSGIVVVSAGQQAQRLQQGCDQRISASVAEAQATPPCAARRWHGPARPQSAGRVRKGARARSLQRAGLYGRGLIYQGEKQHQQAIEDFTAANGLTPQRAEPLLGRATSYLALDKVKEAAADLDEAVQADPTERTDLGARGLAYERLGDKAKAAASYSRALASAPRTKPREAACARRRQGERYATELFRQYRVEHRLRGRQHVFGDRRVLTR